MRMLLKKAAIFIWFPLVVIGVWRVASETVNNLFFTSPQEVWRAFLPLETPVSSSCV
jgi:ABC-type nitrate/sulfonate/bicarbonate transport system permease component